LVEELCSRLGTRVTTEDVRAVVAAHNVKKRNEWFYQGKAIGSPALYGPQFAGWFVDQVRRNPDFLDRARQKRRRILAQRRAARTA
jgi:hypothetical protein